MVKPNNPIIKVPELYQVGIVVRDLEKSIEYYRNVIGIGLWEVIDFGPSNISDLMYHDKPVSSFRYKIALAMVGPIQLELIQPLEGDLIYFDYLKEHGEGLHHLGLVRVKNMDEAIQTLENASFHCLQRGHFGGGRFAYVDTAKALSVVLELLEWPEGVPLPGRP